jgi:hypothetical protein
MHANANARYRNADSSGHQATLPNFPFTHRAPPISQDAARTVLVFHPAHDVGSGLDGLCADLRGKEAPKWARMGAHLGE